MILLTIEFEHKGRPHKAIVRVKVKETNVEYHITIMNGDLERLLYGNHIFVEENGLLLNDTTPGNVEVNDLRGNLRHALAGHLENSNLLQVTAK